MQGEGGVNVPSEDYLKNVMEFCHEKNILFKSKKIGKNKFKSTENFFEPLIQKDKIFFADSCPTT